MRVNQEVMRKMRAYAIKQALSELSDEPEMAEMQYIARRHGLTYAELKQAKAKEAKKSERA
jgi:ribosomal protein L4